MDLIVGIVLGALGASGVAAAMARRRRARVLVRTRDSRDVQAMQERIAGCETKIHALADRANEWLPDSVDLEREERG